MASGIKSLVSYIRVYKTSAGCLRSICLVHPGVRDKRRVSEIDLGDKTIPDSAEPRLESFYHPFLAGIDLPHQGVVDSYNPSPNVDGCTVEVWESISNW